jgi:hypothetical protein
MILTLMNNWLSTILDALGLLLFLVLFTLILILL